MITATSPSAICIYVVHTVGSLVVSYATTTRGLHAAAAQTGGGDAPSDS
jgi:hypothetical protein